MSRVATTNEDFFHKFTELVNNPAAYGGKVTNPGRSLTALVCMAEASLWRIETGYLGEERAEFKDTLINMLTRGPVVIGYSYGTPIVIAQKVGGKIEYWETKQKYYVTTSCHHSGYRVALH